MSTNNYCETNGKNEWKKALEYADPYHQQGTTYLHTPSSYGNSGGTNGNRHHNKVSSVVNNPTGAVVVPISLATTFQQRTPGEATAQDDPNSFGMGYEYSRTGNPTRGAFERAVASAESAKYCVAFASGSAATSAVIHLLQTGDHMVCIDDVYGGTQRYFRRIVHPHMGISMDFVDLSFNENNNNDDNDIVPFLFNNTKTKLIWLETPTNPTMKITDISRISKAITSEHNKEEEEQQNNNITTAATVVPVNHDNNRCLLAVDNTFCSPYFQSPLQLGADLVVHSVTKYIGGHSDVVMGVVCTNNDTVYGKLRFIQNGIGAIPSPFDCFLAHRGLKTLHVRMEAAARNAHAIAMFLEGHEGVKRVLYPGLPSHPQHELAKRQQHGFGAMITFYCQGGREQSACILRQLRVFTLAESLGAVESLAECPSLMTHASVPDDQRIILGIDDTLIRLSVGIESCHDLIDDLNTALNASLQAK